VQNAATSVALPDAAAAAAVAAAAQSFNLAKRQQIAWYVPCSIACAKVG
jgi:hypothetical protein